MLCTFVFVNVGNYILCLYILVVRDCYVFLFLCCIFFFKQKTAYEMRISDWSSDVCSSDLCTAALGGAGRRMLAHKGVVVIHQVPGDLASREQIGRASCRERVCQYV